MSNKSAARVLAGICLAVSAPNIASCSSGEVPDEATLAAERADTLAHVRASGSELERRVLQDGVVTDAELKEGALALVSCAEDEGIAVQVEDDEGGGYKFTTAADAETFSAFERCNDVTYRNIDVIYAIQHSLSPEETERFETAVLDCLVSNGVLLDSWPDTEAPIDPQLESQCVDAASDEPSNAAE